MTEVCTPTPYENKTSPFTDKADVYSAKVSPFGQGEYCPVLLQENGSPILQENRSNINI